MEQTLNRLAAMGYSFSLRGGEIRMRRPAVEPEEAAPLLEKLRENREALAQLLADPMQEYDEIFDRARAFMRRNLGIENTVEAWSRVALEAGAETGQLRASPFALDLYASMWAEIERRQTLKQARISAILF